MKKVGVVVFFDHHDNYIHGGLNIPKKTIPKKSAPLLAKTLFFFDESTAYEEIVRMLIQERRLLHLDDPRLRYNFVLQAFESYWSVDLLPEVLTSLSKPVTLKEGQTLASTHLTHLVMDELEFHRHTDLSERIKVLFCATSIEIRDPPPPKEKPSDGSPNWIEVISVVGGLLGVLYGVTANVASIIGGLDVIERRWREWRTIHHTNPQQGPSHLSGTDIVAIRLRMTHGPDHEFVEWLTDPDRLKVYIEAFKSNSIKPLQAIFVQRNNKALPVDVLEGAQNNLTLDVLLSYLNTDFQQK